MNRIKCNVLALLFAVFTVIPGIASANLWQHLHVNPLDGPDGAPYDGWGDIHFAEDAEVCEDTCLGYIESFDFEINTPLYTLIFNTNGTVPVSDAYPLSWAIDLLTWDLDTFHLTTTVVDVITEPGTLFTRGFMTFDINAEAPAAALYLCDLTQTCSVSGGAQVYQAYSLHAVHVPEPTPYALLTAGLAALGFSRRKRRTGQAIPA